MSSDVKKVYISARDEQLDCWRMGINICKASDKPYDLIIGITRGGAPVSFYLHELFLKYWGKDVGYATLRTRSYDGIGSAGKVEIGSLEEVKAELGEGTRVVLVDDIFDRGMTIEATIAALHESFPQVELITVATLYYKPANSVVDMKPDFYVREYESNEWVVFPHSISDLSTKEELRDFGLPEDMVEFLG